MTFRQFCFTLNNPEEGALEALVNHANFRYCVCQLEKGDSGTPHIQGYAQLVRPMRLNALKLLLPRAHIEKARGSLESNRAYCTKAEGRLDGPWEFGEPTQQGSRTDLASFREALKRGAKDKELFESHLEQMAKYPKLRNSIRNVYINLERAETIRQEGRNVIVLIGATGTGKTRWVYDNNPVEDLFKLPPPMSHQIWFDGYVDQPVALIDDFNGEWMSITYLLNLLDRYPTKVPVKGDFVEWCPKTIYITSNLHPQNWYPQAAPEHQQALMRRLTEIRQF